MPKYDQEDFDCVSRLIVKHNSTGPVMELLADIHLQAYQTAVEDGNADLAKIFHSVAVRLRELGPIIDSIDTSLLEFEGEEPTNGS